MPPPPPRAKGVTASISAAGSSRAHISLSDPLLSAFDTYVSPLLPGSVREDISSSSLQVSLVPLLRDQILVSIGLTRSLNLFFFLMSSGVHQ